MGWQIGYDDRWKRDIGYGVPAYCDHPECREEIDRGLAFVCGGEPYGGEHGCGTASDPFPAKPDHPDWIKHKLTDESWQQWRDQNPETVKEMRKVLLEAYRERRRQVYELRKQGLTFREIGSRVNVTSERARQLYFVEDWRRRRVKP